LPAPDGLAAVLPQMANPHIVRTFREAFTAGDIAEPLLSFDADRPAVLVAATMKSRHVGIAGIRVEGALQGYVSLTDLEGCGTEASGNRMQHITTDQMVDSGAPLTDVVGILARHDHCFVSLHDSVVGIIEREAVNKPVVRMWLFGVISLYEMGLVELIDRSFPNDSWRTVIAPARLEKARELQGERARRNRHSRLIDCLQFSDKAQIMLDQPQVMNALGLSSRRTAKQVVKDLESLRNHLAHAQDIVSHDWLQIIRIAQRMAELDSP
jgi:hypothetical protein